MAEIKLKKGYNINLDGAPEPVVEEAGMPSRVAIRPSEFKGFNPRLAVKEGDEVKIGTPLVYHKYNESIVLTSPVCGEVVEIRRGDRRVLEAVVVQPNGKKASHRLKMPKDDSRDVSRDDVLAALLSSGLFASIVQRPFGTIADPSVEPRDIFISAMDTAPLAPDMNLIVKGNEAAFQTGIDIVSKLTSGQVHLVVDGSRMDVSSAFTQARGVTLHKFSGPHPAGNSGVHIHHIAPIAGRDDVVWTLSVQTLIYIGNLFTEKKLISDTIVAVAGSSAKERKYFKTIKGAELDSFVGTVEEGELRYISGNVLTGTSVGRNGFLGSDDSVVTVIPEPQGLEFMGWIMPGLSKLSYSRTFMSRLLGMKSPIASPAALNGGHRAFIMTGIYEDVLPMDLLPVYLLKAIEAEDINEMEGLGIYEVIEEDLALCEFIDPSKNNIQDLLREGIELLIKEG